MLTFLTAVLVLGGVFIVWTALVCETEDEMLFTIKLTGMLLGAALALGVGVGAVSLAAKTTGLL